MVKELVMGNKNSSPAPKASKWKQLAFEVQQLAKAMVQLKHLMVNFNGRLEALEERVRDLDGRQTRQVAGHDGSNKVLLPEDRGQDGEARERGKEG